MKTLPIVSLFLISLLPASKAAVMGISDSTFAPADWSFQVIDPPSSATYETAQVLSGGNPDAYQTIKCIFTEATRARVLAIYSVVNFNPSLFGAINSIDYSYDRRNFPQVSQYRDVNDMLAIVQGGKIYSHGMGNIATSTTYWEHKSITGLQATDFVEWDAANPGNPDFSSSGGLIQFGYIRGSGTNNSGYRYTKSGTDNWNLTIDYAAVPEPAVAGLLAFGLVLFGRRRRG